MNGTSPVADGSEERPPSPPVNMTSWPGARAHLCFILCGVFTVYAAVSRGPLAVPLVPAQPAVPFFSQSDPVTDYYTGDTPAALEQAAAGRLALLFFYAPWDGACQTARPQLARAARLLGGQVNVLAINCWHLTGDCRRTVKKITAFPFVIVWLRHGRGIQYTGPLEAGHLVRFVERVLRPLRRLETPADLALLQAASTTVAVGYTPFSEGRPPAAYFSLLRASLLSLEERPNAHLAWAVVTNARAADRLRLHHPGGLAVINWNGTTVLKQPATGALSAEVMKSYVSLRRREMAGWLELPASKSNSLQLVLSQGAVLLVLDRRRPLAAAADLAAVTPVRRVWLDYNNCDRSETAHLLGQLLQTSVDELVPAERAAAAACRLWAADSGAPDTACPGRTASAGQPDSCPRPDGGARPDSFQHRDPGLQEMVRQQRRAQCHGLLLHHQTPPEPPPQQLQAVPLNITGLRCSTNRTLSMYMLDVVRHAALARRLGLDPARAGAVILDSKAESQFVLEGSVTAASLARFISDHTAGRLSRTLVSRSGAGPGQGPPGGTGSDPEPAGRGQLSEAAAAATSRAAASAGESSQDGPSSGDGLSSGDGRRPLDGSARSAGRRSGRPLAGLTEMTSQTFRQVALNSSEDVIVFFYSVGCGHCSAYNHVFLAVMRLFVNSGLRFARIDGSANDLRWEFSLESFPTIMYLPAWRKSESHVFPPDLPLTLAYLLRFVLANASSAVRHAFFYGQCDAACRATTAYRAHRQAALVRRRQQSGARRTLARHAAELARLRRALRVAVTARAVRSGS